MSKETKMANRRWQETIGKQLCLAGKFFFLGIAKDSTRADVKRVVEALGGSVTSAVDKRLFAAVTDLNQDADEGCWFIDYADRQTVDDVMRRRKNAECRTSDVFQQNEEVMVTRSVTISRLPPSRGRDMLSAAREKGLQQRPSPSSQPTSSQVIPPAVTGCQPMASSDQSPPTPAAQASLHPVGSVELLQILQDVRKAKVTVTPEGIRVLYSGLLTQEEHGALCEESELISCMLSRATQLEIVVMSAQAFLQEHRDLFDHVNSLPRSHWSQVAPLIVQAQMDNEVIGIRVEDLDGQFRPLYKRFKHVQHFMSRRSTCDVTKVLRSKAVAKDFVPTADPTISSKNALGALRHQTGSNFKANTVDMKVLQDQSSARGRQSAGFTRKGESAGRAEEGRMYIQERRWAEDGYCIDLPPTRQGTFAGININQKENEGSRKHSKHHKKETSRRRRRRQAHRPSYCECCRQSYVELREHLRKTSHLRFVKDIRNYEELDKFFDTLPAFEDVLSKIVREPCFPTSASNVEVGTKKSTDCACHTVSADTASVMDTTARQGVAHVSWHAEGTSKLDMETSNVSSVERYTDTIQTCRTESPHSTAERSTKTPRWTSQIKASPIGLPGPGGQGEPSITLIFRRTRPPTTYNLKKDGQTTRSSKRGPPRGRTAPSTGTSGRMEPSSSSPLHINSAQTAVPLGGSLQCGRRLSLGREDHWMSQVSRVSCIHENEMLTTPSQTHNLDRDGLSSARESPAEWDTRFSILHETQRNLRYRRSGAGSLCDKPGTLLCTKNPGPELHHTGADRDSHAREVPKPDSLSVQPPSCDLLRVASPMQCSGRDQVLGSDSSSSSDLKPVSKGEKEYVAESFLCSFKLCSIACSLDHGGLCQSNGDRSLTNSDLISGKGMSDMDDTTTYSIDEVVWTGNSKDAHTNDFTGDDDRARAQNELLQYGRQPFSHDVSKPAVSFNILMSGRRGGSNDDYCLREAERRDKRKIVKVKNTFCPPRTPEPNDEGARPHDRENTIEQTRGIAVKVNYTSGRARPRKVLSGLEMKQILNDVKAENHSCDRPTDCL